MNARAKNFQESGVIPPDRASGRWVRLSHLRKLRECEQVAAVCYRVRRGEIEFLLVQTRGSRRWTFPKGSAEPGLTHAQAAALEAFEEAGVHGRIEEVSFARYRRRRDDARNSAKGSAEKEVAVTAYLCEVVRLSPVPESNRNRTWFSAEDARLQLREGRERKEGAEFARVVDRAVARIRRLRGGSGIENSPPADRRSDTPPRDALQKVQFEAFAQVRAQEAGFVPKARRQLQSVVPAPVYGREVLQCEVLEFGPSRGKSVKALGTGTKSN